MVLFRSGKLLESEQAIVKSICGETKSCREIVKSKSTSVVSSRINFETIKVRDFDAKF
jgi:hypothetical protein